MNDMTRANGSTKIEVFWNTCDWAAAIAALPVDGPLPSRTVLVPVKCLGKSRILSTSAPRQR